MAGDGAFHFRWHPSTATSVSCSRISRSFRTSAVIENVMFGLHGAARAMSAAGARSTSWSARSSRSTRTAFRAISRAASSSGSHWRARWRHGRSVILMDEPFSSLDPDLREDARRKIHRVFREHAMTAVFVTHDQSEALGFADRIGVMREGRVEQVGTPEELYSHPATRFVAAFIGGANIMRGVGRGDCVMTSIGRVPIDREATGDVTIALRPEHLEILPPHAGEPDGRIVSRAFHGHDLTIRIEFPESELTVWDDYRCPYRVGERVRVRRAKKASSSPEFQLVVVAAGSSENVPESSP